MKEENPLSPHKRRIQKNKGSYFRVHIGVLGEDKCGKTSLIQTFLTKNFQKEIKENDEFFNEETIKKFILYISNVHNLNDFLIYSVGCKLDKKSKEIKNKTAYIIDNDGKFTTYGQRVKTLVETNNIKKFFATSALLNYNINELFEDAIISVAFREFKKSKYKEKENNKYNSEIYDEFYDRCFIF